MIDYGKILSRVVSDMKPSGIRKFFDIANSMEGVISLGVGEPDFRTPWQIRSAGIRSLERGSTRYTANRGLMELCTEISRYVSRKYGVEYTPKDEVLVTVGGSEAIDASIRAITNPGDEIIIPQPSYVCYEPMTRLAGGVPLLTKLSLIVLSDLENHASPSSGILKIASIFVPNSSSLLSKYKYDGIRTIDVASSESATLTTISGDDVVND